MTVRLESVPVGSKGTASRRAFGDGLAFLGVACMVAFALCLVMAERAARNGVSRGTTDPGVENAVRLGCAVASFLSAEPSGTMEPLECPPVARWAPRPGMRFQALAVYRRLAGRFAASPDGDGVRCMTGPGVATSCNPDCRGIDLDFDGDVDLRDVATMQLVATFVFTGE